VLERSCRKPTRSINASICLYTSEPPFATRFQFGLESELRVIRLFDAHLALSDVLLA
jgi:hypothetical protein